MAEHRLSVQRSARYFTLGEAGAAVREVWMVCHGYGQLAERFLARFAPVAAPQRIFVAPEALSRFYVEEGKNAKIGASWMTREDRLAEIEDYVAYLDAVYEDVLRGLETKAVAARVLGFSQGAATACRWAAMGRARVDRLVVWGGEVPPDLDFAAAGPRLAAANLTLIYGKTDDYFTPKVVAATERRLDAAKVPYRSIGFEGGHELDQRVLEEVVAGT